MKTKQIKGKVKYITPVPFAWFTTKKDGDLVIVCLEQLIEAQKKHESALEEAEKRGIEKVVEMWKNHETPSGKWDEHINSWDKKLAELAEKKI